jgi:hypothetical protein
MKDAIPVILFLIFMILKLTEHIDWSWWWITAPLWGMCVVCILCLLVVVYFQK